MITFRLGNHKEDFTEFKYHYAVSLSLPLESWMLNQINLSAHYWLLYNNNPVGFFCLNPEGMLCLFHIDKEFQSESTRFFDMLLSQSLFQKAIATTQDKPFFNLCLDKMKTTHPIGIEFQDYRTVTIDLPQFSELSFRLGTPDEATGLVKVSGDFFDNGDALKYIQRDEVYMLYNGSVFLGSGVLDKVDVMLDTQSVGMFVHPDYRRQRIGSYILCRLKEIVYQAGNVPIAGCAFENIASRKTLEKSGFIATDRLVEFGF